MSTHLTSIPTEYDRSTIKKALIKLFEQGQYWQKLENKKTLLLKPNFVIAEAPELCATTHPDFYMTLAALLQEKGFEVSIGESPAFGSCADALKAHNVYQECLDKNIDIVEFKTHEEYKGIENSKNYGKLTIAAELQNFDAIINLPKLKVHQQFVFTAATKNLYGCVSGKRKVWRHNLCKNNPVDFAKMVIANAEKANAVLHIADGIQALHVKGPRNGKPYPLGKIIISDNFLELDLLFCKLVNMKPSETPLFLATNKKTFQETEKAIESLLDSPGFSTVYDFIPSYRTDISFSPLFLLRSAYRSFKFKLQRSLKKA